MPRLPAAARPAFAMLSLAALAACSFAPKYEVPAVPLAEHYKEAAADGWTPAAPADHLPRGAWWTRYGDAELNALAERLALNSPDLAAALARYEQASAYRDQSRAALFPSFSLGGKVERDRSSDLQPPTGSLPDYYGNNTLGVSAGYELDLWGRVRNTVKAGDASLAAAAADLESARLSLQAELADSYIQLRGLDIEQQLLQDTVVAYEKALELTQSRQAAGAASGLDVARARTQLQTARSQVSTTAARRAVLEHAIAVLVGASPSSFAIAPRTAHLSLPDVPADVPATLLQRRPDIAAAERRTAQANASVGIARAAWFPTLSLGGTIGYASYERTDWFKASNLFWSAGPNLALTLFNGGLREAQVRQARAALDEAGARYRATALAAFAQVEDNLALLSRYRTAAEDEAQAVAAAQQSVDYAMTRYREGAASYLEVTSAQTAALSTQRDSVSLETNRLRASVALIRALGGGWSSTDGAAPASTVASQAVVSQAAP
ncbi:efflux transporter outer membrane subunit [Solimonas flava]|uniref:efflux transporter outer membrane subunit n=1 Tax=Solimonas flava TaxID=415849 RepID=UPI00068600FA|nr:efflux transporter outer membrane subunit [Solimonas flava]